MKTATKFPRAEALAVAREMCRLLTPVSDRILVAGSLRRGKSHVSDVEILFVPKVSMLPDPKDLFGELIPTNLAEDVLIDLLQRKLISKRPNVNGGTSWGESIKLAIHEASGVPVDFFTATPENWACMVVCKTGSAASNERICNEAIKRGLKWNPTGLGFSNRETGELVIRCRTEEEVFRAVGLICPPPNERND